MAKKDLIRLFVRLYGDPRLREKLARDPEGTLKAAGLSKKERELVSRRRGKAITEYLGDEAAGAIDPKSASLLDMVALATRELAPEESPSRRAPATKKGRARRPSKKPTARKPPAKKTRR
jgi:hypothetical protein